MRIDWWTLALQAVNVLVLIWILAYFFFRPIMDIVARRQEEANKLLADAAHAREEAASVRADAERGRAEITAEQERLMAQARNAAQIERQTLLAQSSQAIDKLRAEADAGIVRERAAAEAVVIDRAAALAIDIAKRLLARFPHQYILRAFVDEICREARASSSDAREGLASTAAAGRPIEVVTAAQLSEAEVQQVRQALEEAIGRELLLAFRSDPGMIAGIELHGQNVIVRNSWRADLDRIRGELSRDKPARET